MPTLKTTAPCPCGIPSTFGDCCGPILDGRRKVATAEQLMRSRYSAFVCKNADYLLATLAPENAAGFNADQVRTDQCEWQGLEIIATAKGGLLDQTGTVEFIARFRDSDGTHALHECSRFERRNGNWLYIDGQFPSTTDAPARATLSPTATQHIGRNDPCPCGSGKKFKKCCG